MKPIVSSLLLIATIPLLAIALEPTNPKGLCDRFIDDKDIALCQSRTEKEDIDWYAGTVCNLQKEDAAFWKCWESAKGKSFQPQSLEKCGEEEGLTDPERQVCIEKAASSRIPASEKSDLFQPLKLKK